MQYVLVFWISKGCGHPLFQEITKIPTKITKNKCFTRKKSSWFFSIFFRQNAVLPSLSAMTLMANDARTCVAPQKKVTRKAFFFRSCYFRYFMK